LHNAAILLDAGHIKGKPQRGGTREGKKTKNFNVGDVLTVQK
jgi:hypothetical protein